MRGVGASGAGLGHEATDTWLPNAPVSQATGHCHAKFNQFLVLCINHDWNVPLCTCSQVCSAYETPILSRSREGLSWGPGGKNSVTSATLH